MVEHACPATQATHSPLALQTPPVHTVPEGELIAPSLHDNFPAAQTVMPRRHRLELVVQL